MYEITHIFSSIMYMYIFM